MNNIRRENKRIVSTRNQHIHIYVGYKHMALPCGRWSVCLPLELSTCDSGRSHHDKNEAWMCLLNIIRTLIRSPMNGNALGPNWALQHCNPINWVNWDEEDVWPENLHLPTISPVDI